MGLFIFAGAVIILLILIMGIYNGLVRKRNYVDEAWSSIDVQLKRKGNILPNLVDTLKMQTSYESDVLTGITAARSGIMQGTSRERMEANDRLNKVLPSLYAVSENYPSLGANESFRKLMSEISDCEDKISYARTRYNISVNTYNSAIAIFPNVLFAGMFGFKPYDFFAIEAQQRKDYDDMRIKDIQ